MPIPLMKKPRRHVIQNRMVELLVAVAFVAAATYLIYDAFDWRNKSMPWPLSGLFWG